MRIKTRKNFWDLKQYKKQVHKPKKGKGSYTRKNILQKYLTKV